MQFTSLFHSEKKYFGDLVNLLDVQLREMKLMNDAIRKLEGHANTSSSLSSFNQEDNRDRMTGTRPTYHKGKSEYDSRPVSSTSPPKPTQLSGPPHPQSYMEIMAMVQRGERPNVRDIDDSPPDPNRPISNPRIAPRAKHVGAAPATPDRYARGSRSHPKAKSNGSERTDRRSVAGSHF
ncbi:hypothetical protein MLD38_032008 [Melastoma candidum]|uniref:Uncharacterized protein n=1 Tax=Melastoma candidum TaxID=119954 RepID=A0ACB9MR19_9MYRT|nr:hypothetical protein MLD38_032008 [Melastoma candidum]